MRTVVPSRRQSEIVTFTHNGITFQGQVSFLPDGRPIEVFMDGGKVGTAVQSVSRDTSVAVSLALQFGAPIETLRAAMTRNDDNSGAGPMAQLLDLVCGVLHG